MHFFALVGKSGKAMLEVGRKKPSSKAIAALKVETGGSLILQGTCVGEDGVLIFSSAKAAPASLAVVLKKAIKEGAGLSFDCEVRRSGDEEDEEAESDEGGEPARVPAAPPVPKDKASDADVEAKKRLTAEFTDVVKSNAAKIKESPDAAKLMRDIKTALDGNKADAAEKLLTSLKTALR